MLRDLKGASRWPECTVDLCIGYVFHSQYAGSQHVWFDDVFSWPKTRRITTSMLISSKSTRAYHLTHDVLLPVDVVPNACHRRHLANRNGNGMPEATLSKLSHSQMSYVSGTFKQSASNTETHPVEPLSRLSRRGRMGKSSLSAVWPKEVSIHGQQAHHILYPD